MNKSTNQSKLDIIAIVISDLLILFWLQEYLRGRRWRGEWGGGKEGRGLEGVWVVGLWGGGTKNKKMNKNKLRFI